MSEVINAACPWVTVERCQAVPHWQLVSLNYRDENASGGNHNIYYTVLDENGIVVSGINCWQGWPDGETFEVAQAGQANIGIWGGPFYPDRGEVGPYFAWIGNRAQSDIVRGMGLPVNRHVCYDLTFKRVTSIPDPIDPPEVLDLGRVIRAFEVALADLKKPS
jgi:hypothetical protein